MTAELKPDFVFIAAAVKSILLFLEIVDVDAKLLAIVEYRSARAALAGHAGKIIERAQLPHNATAFAFATDKRRNITLDPKIRLWIPETDMLQDQSLTVRVRFAAGTRTISPGSTSTTPDSLSIFELPQNCK